MNLGLLDMQDRILGLLDAFEFCFHCIFYFSKLNITDKFRKFLFVESSQVHTTFISPMLFLFRAMLLTNFRFHTLLLPASFHVCFYVNFYYHVVILFCSICFSLSVA